jgi:hypothetical protein
VGGLWSATGLGETQVRQPMKRPEQEEFLRTAERVSPGDGCRFSCRVRLTNEHFTLPACFTSLEVFRTGMTMLADGTRMFEFRDSFRYTIAAYELDKLLELNLVPVAVERDFEGKKGAMSWWVDGVVMSEALRRSAGGVPPDEDSWSLQMSRLWVFAELIHNTGLHPTNLLVDQAWKIWLTSCSESFHDTSELIDEARLVSIDREMYEALGQLSLERMRPTLSDYLSEAEMQSLLARRDRIIEVFDEAARSKGVDAVITKSP